VIGGGAGTGAGGKIGPAGNEEGAQVVGPAGNEEGAEVFGPAGNEEGAEVFGPSKNKAAEVGARTDADGAEG
jgi:hypothetical protein